MSRKALGSYPFDTATPTLIIDLKEGPITNHTTPRAMIGSATVAARSFSPDGLPLDLAAIMTVAPAVVLCS